MNKIWIISLLTDFTASFNSHFFLTVGLNRLKLIEFTVRIYFLFFKKRRKIKWRFKDFFVLEEMNGRNYEYRNEQSNCNLLALSLNSGRSNFFRPVFHNNIPLFPLLTRMAPCEGDLRSTGDDSENFHSLSIHDGGLVRRTTMKHFKERANGRKPPPRLVYKLTAFSEHPNPWTLTRKENLRVKLLCDYLYFSPWWIVNYYC